MNGNDKMDVFMMAAGNGTRLRPLTTDIQKCLLPVGGKPILEWWLDAVFNASCFDKVFVNVHHCAHSVEAWLASYIGRTGFIPRVIDEREALLGTAGTLFRHADRSHDVMVVYTDTFSEAVFSPMFFFKLMREWASFPKWALAGILAFPHPKDGSAGALTIDPFRNVLKFSEKSDDASLAWSGIALLKKTVHSVIGEKDRDLARDVMPALIGSLRVIGIVDAWDIGRGIQYYEQLNQKLLQAE